MYCFLISLKLTQSVVEYVLPLASGSTYSVFHEEIQQAPQQPSKIITACAVHNTCQLCNIPHPSDDDNDDNEYS